MEISFQAEKSTELFIYFVIMRAGLQVAPRDYSLPGTATNQAFNAIGALATIAFAFNTGILPEMQVKWPCR